MADEVAESNEDSPAEIGPPAESGAAGGATLPPLPPGNASVTIASGSTMVVQSMAVPSTLPYAQAMPIAPTIWVFWQPVTATGTSTFTR